MFDVTDVMLCKTKQIKKEQINKNKQTNIQKQNNKC